jgi:protein-glutamine gamma-glutamyltransferase
MHSSIRIAIVLTLSLIWITQLSFSPVLLSVIFAICIGCLWYFMKSTGNHFPKWAIYILTLVALAVTFWSYQSFLGVEAGVAVLSIFLFAKALETKTQRDVIILFNFALFVAASMFLHSQSFMTAVMVLLCLLSCLLGLYRVQTHFFASENSNRLALRQDAKHVIKFVGLALPFFVLLFIFFPRLPPLWHIPIPENKAVTGMSDTMSPGDIAQLSQSSHLAFRIIGDVTQLPNRSELYWRAMVLDQYDGQKWTSSFINQQSIADDTLTQIATSKKWNYQYLPADVAIPWIMALEYSKPLERRYQLRQDWSIQAYRQVQRVEPIALQWMGNVQFSQSELSKIQRSINLKAPEHMDLKAQQLAQQLFKQSDENPKRYIQNVLQWYRNNGFSYTLQPGLLGQHRIDEFLFQSKQGFCEHYASSFVMLMRYAGIPARIVVGYQGGQPSPDAKSWEVRQLDAHAWTEVFVDGRWNRYDPTAMIAPQRIEQGMQDLMSQDASVWGESSRWNVQRYSVLNKMRIWSDYASYQWQSKVVGYNAETQRGWLQKLGLQSSYALVLLIMISIGGLVLLYWGVIFWCKRAQTSEYDIVVQSFSRSLVAEQRKQDAETVNKWLLRLAQDVKPEQQVLFKQAGDYYQQMRYSNRLNSKSIQQFKQMLKTCASALKNKK